MPPNEPSLTATLTLVLDSAGVGRWLRRPLCTLRVVEGPDRNTEVKRALPRLVVGTSEAASLKLTDPTVSALHCEILADERGFRLRDLGAKNGIFLEGRRVVEAWLQPRDQFSIGRTTVQFQVLTQTEDQALPDRSAFGGLRGSSVRMRQLYDQLERAARADASVLLQGESGTGKEVAARALVSEGSRRAGPLVVVDCGSLMPNLAESELFGHERGAFSGAHERHLGALERADGGTIFLDEVGELSLEMQTRLLGVLARKELQRVGGSRPIPVDVRVISATNRDLQREVNAGTFRADLYYRLATLCIDLPALREHREDIPQLVSHFLSILGGTLGPASLQRLYAAEYHGNVRELFSAVQCELLGVAPPQGGLNRWRVPFDPDKPFQEQKARLLQAFEESYLTALLERCGGNVSEAARRAGLNRQHLHTLLQRFKRAAPG